MRALVIIQVLGCALAAQACLLPHEIETEKYRHQKHTRATSRHIIAPRRSNENSFPVGNGNRFEADDVTPRGLGLNDRNLESILNVGEVNTGLEKLHNAFPEVKIFSAPFRTLENRTVYGATIGEPQVFFQSGIHARERGGPDNVLYFMSDLLYARKEGKGVSYGEKHYMHEDVVKALSVGIIFMPLVNPDGVAFDQQSNTCWRKNRNPGKSSDGVKGVGIDLNRNFDALWDYERLFNLAATHGTLASNDPDSEIFHGSSPMSELETQNVAWVMKNNGKLSWFLDLHSFGGDILYSWGDDNSQTTDPHQNFLNKTYDGQRGFLGDDPRNSAYKEYIEKDDLNAQTAVGAIMAKAMGKSGRVEYTARESAALYPTSGGSTDYAMSGYYGHKCGAGLIHGITLEFGAATDFTCPFYPTKETYHESMRQVGTGLMELLLYIEKTKGGLKRYAC